MVFDFNVIVYLLGVAAACGAIFARIAALEKKVERISGIAESAYRLDEWRNSAERRLAMLEHKPNCSLEELS